MSLKSVSEYGSLPSFNAILQKCDIAAVTSFCKLADKVVFGLSDADATYSDGKLHRYESYLRKVKPYCEQCMQQKVSLDFITQTLNLLLSHLHRNVKYVITTLQRLQKSGSTNATVERQTDELLTMMTDMIMEYKSLLRKSMGYRDVEKNTEKASLLSSITQSDSARLTEVQRQFLLLLDTLDERAVIVEGILQNDMDFLLSYLDKRFGKTTATYTHVIETGLRETIVFIKEKEIENVKKMIRNMGFDIPAKLRKILLYTLESPIKDYLISELESQSILTTEETKMAKFVATVQKLYPNPSFHKVCAVLETFQTRHFENHCDLKLSLQESLLNCTGYCGDLTKCEKSKSQETLFYSHVMLEWVRSYDPTCRHRILLPLLLQSDSYEYACLKEEIPALTVWSYFCDHQDECSLKTWISCQYPSKLHPNESQPQLINHNWPYSLALDFNIDSALNRTAPFCKEVILNYLASRRGVFVETELSNVRVALRRLSSIPATDVLMSDTYSFRTTRALTDNFKNALFQFCLVKYLPYVLYFYLQQWRVEIKLSKLKEMLGRVALPFWLKMMLKYKNLAENENVWTYVLETSLACQSYLCKQTETSVDDMLENGKILSSLASIAYSHELFDQFLANPTDKIKEALRELNWATLYSALLTDRSEQPNVLAFQHIDQLLHKNISFDASSIFGLHQAAKDQSQLLPYFSNANLSKMFGCNESLDWTYYLKQGRPLFAFCRLLSDEDLHRDGGDITLEKLRKVCVKVHILGLKLFHQCHVTASCSALLVMLGQDETLLKLHLQVATLIINTVCSHHHGSLEERNQLKNNISKQLVQRLQSSLRLKKVAVREMCSSLEQAIHTKSERHQHQNKSDLKAELAWEVMYSFCSYHKLSLCSRFIDVCAKSDDWLTILTHATLYQFPLQQVQFAARYLPSAVTKQHLLNVLRCAHHSTATHHVAGHTSLSHHHHKPYAAKSLAEKQTSTDDENISSTIKGTNSSHDYCVVSPEHCQSWNDVLVELVRNCEQKSNRGTLLYDHCIEYRNPSLATIAAKYQVDGSLMTMCCWLLTHLPSSVGNSFKYSASSYSLHHLTRIWQMALDTNSVALLFSAIHIFYPQSIMLPFLDFASKVLLAEEEAPLKLSLILFEQRLRQKREIGMRNDCGVFTLSWIEERVVDTLRYLLCDASLLSMLLKLLEQTRLCASLYSPAIQLPDVQLLYKVFLWTKFELLDFKYNDLFDMDRSVYPRHWQHLVQELETKQLWSKASIVCETCKISPQQHPTLKQIDWEVQRLMLRRVWLHRQVQRHFWKRAHNRMTHHQVDPIIAAHFFKRYADASKSIEGKQLMYELVYRRLEEDVASVNKHERLSLFTSIWLNKIDARIQSTQVLESSSNRTFVIDKSQLRKLERISGCGGTSASSLTSHQHAALSLLIDEKLDENALLEAATVCAHFSHQHQHLNTIVACHQLASRSASAEWLKESVVTPSADGRDNRLASISRLTWKCIHGQKLCNLISCLYQIATVLEIDYTEALAIGDLKLLSYVLTSGSSSRYLLAKSFIQFINLPDRQVAAFVCDMVLERLEDVGEAGWRKLEIDRLVEVCQDAALIGERLLERVQVQRQTNTHHSLPLDVSLLICAHECFTRASHMQGICDLLRMCKPLAIKLQRAELFQQLVLLLTGVARYNEMTYIFDILKSHQQFELIFRKQTHKDKQLRLAILDYLERYHTDDTEMYTMVALHFAMYRQIAEMLQTSAERLLLGLSHSPIGNTLKIQKELQKIVHHLSDAAESFIKEGCVRQAEECIKQVKLVALQLQLLHTDTRVINLNTSSVASVVLSLPKLHHINIVLEAYGQKNSWASVYFHYVIITGDFKVMNELQMYHKVQPTLIYDITDMLLSFKERTQQHGINLKKLLLYCQDQNALHVAATTCDKLAISDDVYHRKYLFH